MEDDFEFGELDEVKFGELGLAAMWRMRHSCHNLYKFKLKILLCTRSSMFSETAYYHFQNNSYPPSNLPQMLVSSLTSGSIPSGENTMVNFHEDLRRFNLYPHF